MTADEPRPLVEHLEELRHRLFRALGAWAALSALAGYWAKDVFEILMRPAVAAVRAHGHTLIATSPPELFVTYVKSALLAGFLGAMPVILYQAWSFVAPGLYANERRFVFPFTLAAALLFAAGCAFGYFLAFPLVFEWFLSLEGEFVTTAWTTKSVFGFMAGLYLAFGLAFEMPIVLVSLTLARVLTPQTLAHWRRHAIVVMFVVAAVLTPADPGSQVMLAIPLCLLYEASIWVSRALVREERSAVEPAAAGSEGR